VHYILYLVLEGFFVQIKAPDRAGPVAVLRDKTVLDVNPTARQRGITPGMEKRTARAVAHETQFYIWEEDTYEEAQAKWLDLCTEFTGIIEPEEQNSAYLDLSAHPNPIDVSEKLIRTLVQKTGLRAIYGSSLSKWIARLASKHGDCGSAAIDPAKFLSGLPISQLTPVSAEHRQRLNFLGYRTIGEVLTIPEGNLCQQFGAEGLFIAKAAKGDFGDPVSSMYPRDSLIETIIFDGAVDSTEAIDHALKSLSTRIAKRLSNKNLQGQEVTFGVEFENGKAKQLTRRFSKSIHNFPGSLASLRILFNDLVIESEPLRVSASSASLRETENLEITAIRTKLSNLKQCREKQTVLLGRSKTDSAAAVNVVRTVFGDASVQLGAEIAVPRRVKVLREWKNATGWS
jgi:nucleotidyltransferase/DNA polymerase involved in DNA repair